MRRSEILKLRWCDIDFTNGFAFLFDTKKVPKPTSLISPPPFSSEVIVSNTASTAFALSLLFKPVWSETLLTRSFLFTLDPLLKIIKALTLMLQSILSKL